MNMTPTQNQTTPCPVQWLPAGGVTSAKGFSATGAFIGIKKKRPDLALVYSSKPCVFALCTTQNTVKAAPVIWCQAILASQPTVSALVINSGNANACTGEAGVLHTQLMAQTTANALQLSPEVVLVASTGIIGVPMPIEIVTKGIETIAPLLNETLAGGSAAAEAIRTTDTFAKEAALTVNIGGKTVTLGGMSKGSGMIHPNMATMLGFVTTDVAISKPLLQKALGAVTVATYNQISVDGDTSTNDMVVVLANGEANNTLIDDEDSADYQIFLAGLMALNTKLAKLIAKDGEGASKLLEVVVSQAETVEQARALAKAVIASNLVKSAFFGESANWGRILSAMGGTGLAFNPLLVSMQVEGILTGLKVSFFEAGQPVAYDAEQAKTVLKETELRVCVQLASGVASGTAWGCDLTHEYVTINADYMT
jgi:glutamate N-acetyltransferase / amino-acid N-acetyltransferase